MGLFDLFRPKWKHSNAEVRAEAVRQLAEDDTRILGEVALKDSDSKVRRLALKKLVDPDLLEQVASGDPDETLRKLAVEKVGELLVTAAISESEERANAALARISDGKALAEVAKRAQLEDVRREALDKISDDKALGDVARNAGDWRARKLAVERISDAGILRTIALNDSVEEVKLAAVARVSDEKALEQLAQKAKSKAVKNAAKERLSEIAPGRETPQPKAAVQRKAQQRQLCARAEAAVDHKDFEEASAEMQSVTAAWDDLGHAQGDDQQLWLRYDKAVDAWEARKKKLEPPAPPPAPVEKPKAPPAKKAEKPKKEKKEEKAKEEPAAKAEPEAPKEDPEKARREAERAAEREEAKKRLEALCARLEEKAALEEKKALEEALKDAQDEREQIKLPREEALVERYEAARRAIVVKLQEMRETEDWKRWANVPKLEALIVKVEALLEAAATEPKKARDELKALQAEWKAAGPVPRDKNEALWGRFKKAADEVYNKTKEQFAQEDARRDENLKRKEELCARVEAIAESTDWKETAETIKLLQEEWKAIGPAPKEKNDEIWKRFRGACDKFFERRKAHFSDAEEHRAGNLKQQEELCAEAEKLSGSTDWKFAADELKRLQAEWKQVGPAPKDKADEVWKRFRAACDKFFERRKAHFAEMDEEREGNLKKKEALVAMVEALVEGESEDEAAVKEAQAEWKKIGPVPKEKSDALWERFRGACDKFYDRRRKADEEAMKAVQEQATGVSGFANKLPLADIKLPVAETKPETKPESKPPVPEVADSLAAGWAELALDTPEVKDDKK